MPASQKQRGLLLWVERSWSMNIGMLAKQGNARELHHILRKSISKYWLNKKKKKFDAKERQ